MKKQGLSNLLALAAICIFSGTCASTGGNMDSNEAVNFNPDAAGSITGVIRNFTSFSDVVGEKLLLIEVSIETTFNREIIFNREELTRVGIGDIYTLNFDAAMVSGTGSPNLYSAPYTLGQGQAITINLMRSTLMASLFEPERLPEHQFFSYMQNVHQWRIRNGRLELLSKTDDGSDVRMAFQ